MFLTDISYDRTIQYCSYQLLVMMTHSRTSLGCLHTVHIGVVWLDSRTCFSNKLRGSFALFSLAVFCKISSAFCDLPLANNHLGDSGMSLQKYDVHHFKIIDM